MKKFISLILTLVIITLLCACSNEASSENKKLKVVATIFPYYDFAQHIAGDFADVDMLMTPGSDVHSYEPTPSDIGKIQECDLFIYNGGESDTWVDKIIDSLDSDSKPEVLKMMDCTTLVKEMDADHNVGEDNDEHIWTSPVNAMSLIEVISAKFGELDNKNSSFYDNNGNRYIKEIDAVHKCILSTVNESSKKKIVVADRFPLLYFTNTYNLDWECAFPGCSSETEPGLARLSKLQDTIKREGIKSIFKLDLSENNVADTVAEDTGAKVITFYSCETLSQQDFDNGESYSGFMARNLTSLKEALS